MTTTKPKGRKSAARGAKETENPPVPLTAAELVDVIEPQVISKGLTPEQAHDFANAERGRYFGRVTEDTPVHLVPSDSTDALPADHAGVASMLAHKTVSVTELFEDGSLGLRLYLGKPSQATFDLMRARSAGCGVLIEVYPPATDQPAACLLKAAA